MAASITKLQNTMRNRKKFLHSLAKQCSQFLEEFEYRQESQLVACPSNRDFIQRLDFIMTMVVYLRSDLHDDDDFDDDSGGDDDGSMPNLWQNA